jgi:SAM-dependent methyltransferase
MSLTGFLYSFYLDYMRPRQKRKLLETQAPKEIKRADWERSLTHPTEFYEDCFRFFHQHLPAEIREHRNYYHDGRFGFGEDAFHVMWYLLFNEFKPANFLEIGVYRGQTISLAALLARRSGLDCHVTGVSPFSGADDSKCKYPKNIDYMEEILQHFRRFSLPEPELCRAYSTDPEAVKVINSIPRDIIYIDGNHDWEVVVKDWENCARSIKPGGLIVMDDSGSTTSFRPPLFATAGFPDPSRFCQEIDKRKWKEILQVGHNRVFQKIG